MLSPIIKDFLFTPGPLYDYICNKLLSWTYAPTDDLFDVLRKEISQGKSLMLSEKGHRKVMENEFYKVVGTIYKTSCARPG